jgi:hypothetical protein
MAGSAAGAVFSATSADLAIEMSKRSMRASTLRLSRAKLSSNSLTELTSLSLKGAAN